MFKSKKLEDIIINTKKNFEILDKENIDKQRDFFLKYDSSESFEELLATNLRF